MSIYHPKAIQNMRRLLANIVEKCEVKNSLLFFDSCWDEIDKFIQELLKNKDVNIWVTRNNITTIFFRKIYSALPIKTDDEPKLNGILKDVVSKNKIEQFIGNMLQFIQSIPKKYSIYFPLPLLEPFSSKSISLSEDLSIVRFVEEDLKSTKERRSLLFSYLWNDYADLKPNISYVHIKQKGFFGNSLDDSAVVSAFSKFKQLVYLGLLQKTFCLNENSSFFPVDGLLKNIYVIGIDNENLDVKNSISLPWNIKNYINKIKINETEKYNIVKEAGTDTEYLKFHFKVPITLINSNNNNTLPIKSAIEWAFDAAANENETIAFLQTCIGLEAILGDDDNNTSLTELLANRCAYLLGTMNNRKQIKKDFKELYRIRSKLVHGRVKSLQEHEKDYFSWGKNILDRVIAKEIVNLKLK